MPAEKKTNLPPAGDARNEELKKRSDELEAKIEAASVDAGTIDLKKVQIENEIAQHIAGPFNELEVSDAQEGKVYRWVYIGQQGRAVTQARFDKWEVVQGNDPEATELKHVDSTRRLADVILMRTSVENYDRLQYRDRLNRQRQQEGITQTVYDMGQKAGLIVKPYRMDTPQAQQASQHIDRMIRQGTVPGLPVNK